jgi:DNA-binding SARP family transcriptional activator
VHRLYLLGGIGLRDASGEATADHLLAQSKAVAMLAYLALSPAGRFQRRDRLVGLLWPELDQEHARAALRKALHIVRGALGEGVVATRGDEELTLASAHLWCDATAFEQACEEGHLEAALELYEGELMPGFHLPECGEYDAWLEEQRAGLRERAVSAAWALAQILEKDLKRTLAGQWARRAVQYAGTDERVLRRTMQMLDRVGDRAGALRLYTDFTRRLRKELDVDPSPETAALASSLRGREA